MRKQYFFRESEQGLLAWDVDRLVDLSRDFPRIVVPLDQIGELDRLWAGDGEQPTWRSMVEHMHLIADADLSFPIIIAANGEIMDGRHRLAKAALQKLDAIVAVQFMVDPDPDYVGISPEDLPY